jgi:hypothetical protein
MKPTGRDADFAPEPEFAAIGELGRRIVQYNGAIDLAKKTRRDIRVFGYNTFGMSGGIPGDVVDRAADTIDGRN